MSGLNQVIVPKAWTVGNVADCERLARKCDLEDFKDGKVSGAQFVDPFLWTEEWNEPFSCQTASTVLKYREGYVTPQPKRIYRHLEAHNGFIEYNKYMVRIIFNSTNNKLLEHFCSTGRPS
jgi:hypothetical protein